MQKLERALNETYVTPRRPVPGTKGIMGCPSGSYLPAKSAREPSLGNFQKAPGILSLRASFAKAKTSPRATFSQMYKI
jgi:hypothetical protein